jgi:hypothetical protein
MAIKNIKKEEWTSYFNDFSKRMRHKKRNDYVEIRILSKEMGSQVEAEWLPLEGISYDERSDTLYVTVDHLNHQIPHPSSINVDEDDIGFLSSMEIQAANGERDIIELR